MSIYLELKDADVKGDVTSKGYEENMKVETLKFKVSRDRQYDHNNTHKSASLSDLMITKYVDKSAVSLLQASFKGHHFAKAIFKFTRDIGSVVKTYMEYELSDAYITEYSLDAEGDSESEPKEIITFAYSKIKYSYSEFTLQGKPRSKQDVAYDRYMNRVK